jgi:Glycosyl transferase family 11
MISFNNLGNMGRLGNQMFQYASLKGIAKKRGYSYSIPNKNELNNCFYIKETLQNKTERTIIVEKFEFNEEFFNDCPDNVDIRGYFQTEKYFKHIEQEIRSDFTFVNKIYKPCKDYINSIYKNNKVISLHVRRGDYLTDPNFECLDLNYYYEALEELPDFPVLIVSDDPEWCKEKFKGKKFNISLTKNTYFDLCLMTICDYHIIANSSFSWWGSWLANSKKTIAPKNWFSSNGSLKDWNTKDLYLPDWIII